MSKEVLFEKLCINNSSYRRLRDYEQNVGSQIVDQLSNHYRFVVPTNDWIDELEIFTNRVYNKYKGTIYMKKTKNLIYLFKRSWKISKGLIFIAALKSIFFGLQPLINIVGLGIVIDSLITKLPLSDVINYILIFVGVNLAFSIIGDILDLIDVILQRKTSDVMQMEYMEDCVNINYHYVQDKSILDLKKKSMSAHPAFFLRDISKFSSYIIQFAGIVFIFSLLSVYFLIAIFITSFFNVVLVFAKRKKEFNFKNECVEDEQRIEYIFNVMTGYRFAKEIRINNAGALLKGKYHNVMKNILSKFKRFCNKLTLINTTNTIITVIQTFIMYAYFSYLVFDNKITIAEYTVLLGATALLTNILISFFDNIASINQTIKYTDLYREYKNDIKMRSGISLSNQNKKIDIDMDNYIVVFENVSFVYPNTKKIVLDNLNLEIRKGDRIGLVGLNGSGKTTLIKLLTRLYNPTKGKIALNGIDIKDIPLKQYSDYIGIVLQDFYLFAYTIKENIVFNKPFNQEKFEFSIEKSGLLNFIDSLENKEETYLYKEISKDGLELSGGNGQKLAIARVMYKDSDFLVFDEPTSSLDPIAEYDMFWQLYNIAKDKTSLFISHRLSSTKFCDKIIVLDNGKMIEYGTHEELMERKGLYHELFSIQANQYLKEGS